MAVTQVYTAVALDVITAARWNNEFGNIYNNGTDVAFPLTKAASLAGFTLTLDSAGASSIISTGAIGLNFTAGAKSGTPGVTGANLNIAASTFTDSNTAGSGTATRFAANAIQRPTLAAVNSSVLCTDAATLYIANSPANGTNETITNPWSLWIDDGHVRFDGNLRVDGHLSGNVALQGYVAGLIQSNDAGDVTNDIGISIGQATSDDATQAARKLMTLTSALVKQLDVTWAVGTGQGMLDSGAIANADYFLFLIMRSDTGVVDVLASLSATSPTMPANYTYKRLIGWIRRTGAALVLFKAIEISGGGLRVTYSTPLLDIDLAATLTTSRRSDVISVPLGVRVKANLTVVMSDAATSLAWVGDGDEVDAAPSTTAAPLHNLRIQVNALVVGHQMQVLTDTAGKIYARANVATMDTYKVVTSGFEWSRR